MYDIGHMYVQLKILSELSQIYFIKQNPTIMSCGPIFSVLKYKTVERCFDFFVVCCCKLFLSARKGASMFLVLLLLLFPLFFPDFVTPSFSSSFPPTSASFKQYQFPRVP